MFLHGVGEQEKCTFRGSGSKCSLSGVIVGWGAVGGHVLGGCCGLWGGGFVGQAGLGVGRRPEANQACERARYACNVE